MTIAEMHIAVKQGLDKSESLQLPAFEPEEIDFWLNDTILEFVKTRLTGNNSRGKAFEQDQKRIDDLRTLVTNAILIPETGSKPNSFVVRINNGVQLLPSTGWTSTGWTGSLTAGWTHTAGNTSALSNTRAALVDTNYTVDYTVTGRTAGSFSLSFGGETFSTITATGTQTFTATTVSNLVITPTTDFDGTIDIVISQSDFPSNYYFFLNDEVTVEYLHSILNQTVSLYTGVTECTSDNYMSKLSDPYGEHILHMWGCRPLRMFSSEGIELITDGNYDVTEYYLRYIRKPATVDSIGTPTVDCDLPEHTHSEIVKMTVNKLLENIEAPRYQTHSIELTKVE